MLPTTHPSVGEAILMPAMLAVPVPSDSVIHDVPSQRATAARFATAQAAASATTPTSLKESGPSLVLS